MIDFASARTKMVDSQVRTEGVTDLDLIAAMSEVAREAFVPERSKALAYVDSDILLSEPGSPEPRHLMRPAAFARLVQAVEIGASDAVLDVGCGTGYSAAVLARLAHSVVALEVDARLASAATAALGLVDGVVVATGPLQAGYPARGPYDVIIVEGAVEEVPERLLQQLKQGGRLVAVVGYGRAAPAMVFTRTDGDFGSRPAFDAKVPALGGFERRKAFVF